MGTEWLFHAQIASKHTLVSGLVLESEELARSFSTTTSASVDEKPPAPPTPELLGHRLFSLYSQWDYKLASKWRFILGGRLDHSSAYNDVFTPRTALIFSPMPWHIKMLYTEAFRAPKPWDYTDGAGNADLSPERMRSMEVTGQWPLSSSWLVEGSLFYNQLEALFCREELANDQWRWINQGDLNTLGLEASLRYRRRWGLFWVNYSYTRSEDEQGRQIAEIQPHHATAGLEWFGRSRWQAGIRAQYRGEVLNPQRIESTGSDYVSPSLVLHANIAWRLSKTIRFHLDMRNLLDAEYYHTSNRPPDRYRQPQRTLLLRLDINAAE